METGKAQKHTPPAFSEYNKEKEYWLSKLSGELVRITFHPDRIRENHEREMDTLEIRLSPESVERLLKISGGGDAKLYIILQTVLTILIDKYQYRQGNDVIVGSPVYKQGIDGDFINTVLALRNQLSPETTFKELLLNVRQTVIEANENQNYSIKTLLYNLNITSPRHEDFPLFDIAVLLENIHDKKYLQGINLNMIFSFLKKGGCIEGKIGYNTCAYDSASVQRIASHFIFLLETTLADLNIKLSEIVLQTEEEKDLFIDFNSTQAPYPRDRTIHELFERQVHKTPDNVALRDAGGKSGMSYRELNAKAEEFAYSLEENGVGPGTIVSLTAERSPGAVIAILGILKAGAVFLPIDAAYPEKRKKYIMEDSGSTLLLVQNPSAPHLDWNGKIMYIEDEITDGNTGRPPFPNKTQPGDLAYIIYTSGSTGNPKGVMVEYRGLVNYIWWAAEKYVRGEKADFPLFTSLSFDLTLTSIFTPLLTGNAVVVYPEVDNEMLVEKIIDDNLTEVVKLTPSHLKLIREKKIGNGGSSVKRFIVGGENLESSLAKDIHGNFGGNIEIYNEYGPTEAVVGCMIHKFDPAKDNVRWSVPIGKPAANTRIYLLDENKNPVPQGGIGELYIAGDGVARGYLNRPYLTREKFCENPFQPGERMYRTGDKARWLPNSVLGFCGRVDQQVKIRGYRIELGEIENIMMAYPPVKEAVVLANESQSGDNFLCGYAVSSQQIDEPELREFLSHRLPDYMIPLFFKWLDSIPLTENGKIDNKELQGLEIRPLTGYQAPGNEQETELVEIWQDVLGIEKVGVNDNFFMIGGDSIKTIQVASRMNRAGYKVEMKGIFRNPTIAQLAPILKKSGRIIAQAAVSGEVPLTPIQQKFFREVKIEPHHFNQAIMLYSREGFEEDMIRIVFSKMQEHHDALRMTFNRERGLVIQRNSGLEYPLSMAVYDLRNRDDSKKIAEMFEFRLNDIQKSINLETGPLMKLGLFHMDDGDRLLIVVHHLVIDGVSWRIILEDFETMVQQYKKGEPLELPPKVDSFKVWAEKLFEYANSPSFLGEKKYWEDLESTEVPPLVKDFAGAENYRKDAESISFRLSKEDTELLLTRVHHAFGTEINDILLTALGLGVKRTFGNEQIMVDLESHGREELFDDVDIKRTVGWFTNIYPVLLDISYEYQKNDLSRQIKEIKEQLRRVPHKGIGHGIMKYLTSEKYRGETGFKINPQIGFNYLGQFDSELGRLSFELSRESVGMQQSIKHKRQYDLEISGFIADKTLTMHINFNKLQYKRITVERLSDSFRANLKRVIAYCAERKKKEPTPSDFTYPGLSIRCVDRLVKQYPIEDIYPLTPMQEGMLFHTLYDPSSSAYFVQTSYLLAGTFDTSILERSLQELFKRYDVLRTSFIYAELERPVQVVLEERPIDFLYKDIREEGINTDREKESFIKTFKEEDRARSFDVSGDALMRVAVLRTEETRYEFIWSFHHLIMDGWCTGILASDFFEIYSGYIENRPCRLPPVTPYRVYMEWLGKQDREGSKRYWAAYLEGYEEQVSVPAVKIPGSGEMAYKKEIHISLLKKEQVDVLHEIAGENHVTLNTLFQSVWGIIAGKYGGKRDVVFGAVVSGRPPEIETVESMVGLFINTVPLRVEFNDKTSFGELLKRVRAGAVESESHHHYPLADIQGESVLKQNLLDHILVYENYPVVGRNRDVLKTESVEQTNYDFNIVIVPRDRVSIRLEYNSNAYEPQSIERIAGYFKRVFDKAVRDRNFFIDDVELLTEEEKQSLLFDFNNTRVEYPGDKTIHELFERRVEKTPDSIAVMEPGTLSYGELNRKANQLAHSLRQNGVKPGTIISLSAERSMGVIIAMIGILKAGGAYLPIDPEYPEMRKQYILADSGTSLLLAPTGETNAVGGAKWKGRTINLEHILSDPPGDAGDPVKSGHPSDPAYVIYTSGSTGKPKGVMIEHRGLVNYIWWAAQKYVKPYGEPVNFPLYSSLSFDLTVTSIFTPLITGNSIIVYEGDDKEFLLGKIIDDERIGVIKLTPSHLKLIKEKGIKGNRSNIKAFIVGGEALDSSLAREIHEGFHGSIDIYNEYGPTETVVGCMIYKFDPHRGNRPSVPIGIPANNVQIYVLDGNRNPLPPGAQGELYISGEGVARGYLNRFQLTAETFVESPFKPGQRMYKTGDLARMLPDGNIEFLGRNDYQVKIRGFRIELGEIENKLTRHNEIKDALITVKENENGDKGLCAYVVLNRELDLSEIREYVSGELPDYMIPSYFINIEKIPLNPHGKVDHGALPDPMGIGMKENIPYIPPRDMIEKLITEVWEKVLGRKKIGVNENFFMLGGDSIKSIQIISRISGAGYKLQMRDLFQYPVISDLALRVKKTEHIPDQAPVMGVVPLTLIQEWFFDKHRIDIHHFNQAVMFYSSDGFDEGAIKAVFAKIQEHHDALRMTYKEENGKIIQINHGLDYPLSLQVFDLKNRENSIESLEARANEIQAGIHLETGPLMKLGLFHLDDGDRLLIVIHHLVIDGVSWRILFEDIETLYRLYKKGEPLTLPLKTDPLKVWAEKLSDYANSETFLKEKAYWAELESTKLTSIEKYFDEPNNYRKDATALSFILNEQETGDLLTKVNDAFGTGIDDILLTALGMGINKTWGHNRVSVSLEGHGREEILEGIDISRTLGWFTSTYPLVMDISYEDDPGRQIKEVKEAIRRVPNKGIGYGILKYITSEEHKKDIRFQLNPQFGFNYLGQFDAEIGQMSFEIARESSGNEMSREGERELDFDISGMIANKRLGITVTYNKKHYKPETINLLVNHFRDELKYIIALCCSKENTEPTPSDFTYKGLSIGTIDRLMASYSNLEDLYTLTPMQEGMLFHALYNESSSAYFVQILYHLRGGELDISLVEKSVNELFKRHDMLRTTFVYQNIERPVQVVLKERKAEFFFEDIRQQKQRADQEVFIEDLKVKDRTRRFDLTGEPLIRMAVIQTGDTEYHLIWSFHHILMDGWCAALLSAEFLEIYNCLSQGITPHLSPVTPFRDYILWLEKQDRESAKNYWKNLLEGYVEPVTIPRIKNEETGDEQYSREEFTWQLEAEKTKALEQVAVKNQVTLNGVFQAVWGILLAKYNNKQDVVFGIVVSGRSSEIPGIESMVGLFINTIPVRIGTRRNISFSRLLQETQQQAINSAAHDYYPLAEIQVQTPLRQGLMNHFLTFLNYPSVKNIQESLNPGHNNDLHFEIEVIEAIERSNYNLDILINAEVQLAIKLRYNTNVYDSGFMRKLVCHIEEVVDQVIENDNKKIEDILISHDRLEVKSSISLNDDSDFEL